VHTVDTQLTRQRLQAALAELDRSVLTLTPETSEGDHHGTPGDADAGLDLADTDRANALVEVATEARRQVLDALDRLDAGVYGRCVVCGAALPADRLEARPEAARCMTCQSRTEAGSR